MKTEVLEIRPSMARDMLRKNTCNRPLSATHLQRLAREMKSGQWKLNGEPIILNGETLVDGQHRLTACVLSNASFQTLVVYGVPQDAFDTIDVGRRRSAGDTLATRGEKNGRNLAAALAFVDGYMTSTLHSRRNYTNIEITAILIAYPGIRDSVSFMSKHTSRGLIPHSIMCGCHYLFACKDRDLADLFCEGLIHGADLRVGEPVYILRERLMINALSKAKLKRIEVAALVVKAWNAMRDGHDMKTLRWRSHGDAAESFPLVK